MSAKIVCALVVTTAFFVSGCVNLTPEQQSKLKEVNAFPTQFTMDKSEAADAWGRAQSFIGRFSSMKLQTATDYVIQTYTPTQADAGITFGYNVTKTPAGDVVQFDVSCSSNNVFAAGESMQNARALAYYIKTGELVGYAISR